MRKRRTAAVFAGSLLAHVAIAVAWLTTHPPPRFVEPATFQVELIRPPPRERQRPTPPRPNEPPRTAAQAVAPPAAAPPAAAPVVPPDLAAITPKVVDPRLLTDQELLQRAGPRPDINKVFADEARQPVFSRALGRNPEDMTLSGCKPFTEHSRRIAPPCPVRKTPGPGGAPAPGPTFTGSAKDAAFAAGARAKAAVRTYKGQYGSGGTASVNDYPSLRCVFGHTHCSPADPTMDPLHPPRDH